MNIALQFKALGIPQVQGNHRATGRGKFTKIYDANENLPGWRLLVSEQAARAFGDQHMILGPVIMWCSFWVPRPKSAPKTRDIRPITRGGGDWDKLARAIGDSLVDAGVLKDDSQICDAFVTKRYAVTRDLPIFVENWHWEQPGVYVRIGTLEEEGVSRNGTGREG